MEKTNDNALFNDSWWIYQRVLAGNYMYHQAMYQDLNRFLATRFGSRPFSVLDLGCGDAQYIANTLSQYKISHYLGIDLSPTAIAKANDHLKAAQINNVTLQQGELLAETQKDGPKYDVVFCSFALHHLSRNEKQAFFHAAQQRLPPSGILLLIDVVRENDETLPLYLERYCAWVSSSWQGLPLASRQAICEHVLHNDLPETAATLNQMAQQSGLTTGQTLSHYKWHRSLFYTMQH